MDLRGKTVLITGAARGIGAETARQVSARGARIALVGLEPEELAARGRAVRSRRRRLRGRRDRQRTRSTGVVEAVVERFGGIDVVMANAGVARHRLRALDGPGGLRAHHRGQPARRLAHGSRLPAARDRAARLRARDRLARGGRRTAPAWPPTRPARRAPRRSPTRCARRSRHLGVDVGVGYFAFLDTDMVRGGDTHPVFGEPALGDAGPVRQDLPAVGRRAQDRGGHRGAPARWWSSRAGSGRCWCCAGCSGRCSTAARASGRPRSTPPSSATWPSAARSAARRRSARRQAARPSRAAERRPAGIVAAMAKRDPRMVPLGYGKFVRADRVFALVPLEGVRAPRRPAHLRARGRPVRARGGLALRARDPRRRGDRARRGGRPAAPRRNVAATGQESLL